MWKTRVAVVEDAAAIASVHVRAWQTTYRGIVADEVLDGLKVGNRIQQWTKILGQPTHHTFVVEDADQGIIGFANGGSERRGDLGFEGELYAIYLLQEFRGQGIGTTLFRQIVDTLWKSGMANMMLWVLEENPYRDFYEGMGGSHFHTDTVSIGGRDFKELAFGWQDLGSITP